MRIRYEVLQDQHDTLLAACKAARGTKDTQGLFGLGIGVRNQELDQSDGPGAMALRGKADAIHAQLDAAIAGAKG